MKKYIISQEQFDELLILASGYESPALQQLSYELKPIEPLSETEVYNNDMIMSNNYMPMAVIMELVRVIERHIIGEEP